MLKINEDDVIKVGKLVLHKNTLWYDNSVVQIRNICSVWVEDNSYRVEHNFPVHFIVLAIIGALLLIYSIIDMNFLLFIIGAALVGFIVWKYKNHNDTTDVNQYLLGVERSSGRIKRFVSKDIEFIKKAALAISQAILDEQTQKEPLVINFESKEILVENSIGTSIYAGDINGSLVETISRG